MKPRLFGSRTSFGAAAPDDGILLEEGGRRVIARFAGSTYELTLGEAYAHFSDGVIEVVLDPGHRVASSRLLAPREGHALPLGRYHALRLLRDAVLAGINPLSAAWLPARAEDGRPAITPGP